MSRPADSEDGAAQLAVGGGLGAGMRAGGGQAWQVALYERQQQQEQARIAAAKAAEQKAAQLAKAAAQDLAHTQTDQDLLATVDSDISREFRPRWSRWLS